MDYAKKGCPHCGGSFVSGKFCQYCEVHFLRAKVVAMETAQMQGPQFTERVAQITAHRACCGIEHDPEKGKFHGYCIVCGVPFPCDYVGEPPKALPR